MQQQKINLDHLIGQEKLKGQIQFYLEAFQATHVLPHMLLVGPKGAGKTEFAKALAKNLRHPATGGRPKPLLTINSSTVKNVKQFVEDIILKYVQDQTITLFFDECHELPESVQTTFLTILNPNQKNVNTLRYEEAEIVFDFSQVSFVFASTDPQKILGPFKDRCQMLYMDEYDFTELGKIIELNIGEFEIAPSVLPEIAAVCRGNARSAVKMGKDRIYQYMSARKLSCFEKRHWAELCDILGILPLGLETAEVCVLKALNESPSGCSLNNLAAKTGYTTGAIQREFEMYLVKHNLMTIGQGGRQLLPKGRKYLLDNFGIR